MNEIKFQVDTKHRKQWFTGISFSHPAKMSLPLQVWIIENFTKPGEVILDPMAGSGTLMVCCSMGRHCILAELEQKFCKMMWENWQKVRQRGCQLGYQIGTCQIIQGDARNLTGILVDKCIFSPPFAGADQSGTNHGVMNKNRKDLIKYSYIKETHGDNRSNIANLPYGEIDKIITSPPYENNPGTPSLGSVNKDDWRYEGGDIVKRRGLLKGYDGCSDNIGNLKSTSYLEAMKTVYEQCFGMLKNGGLMILVTKNLIRNKQIVRLDEDTIKLCEQAGFKFVERHYRKLTSMSFWRIIYKEKYPEAPVLDKEDILVFKK